jgi:8-oxo-dGTP pyrophosphatase MutT (NUDIX family)
MVVRDTAVPSAGTSLEVLMVRRNLRSDFVGGAYVFPGGGVDPLDGGPGAEALCAGRDDAEANALLGLESGGLAYWVAAVRETFEEAGLLLGRRRAESAGSGGDPPPLDRLRAARAAVNAGSRRFLDVCREEGVRLDVGSVHYFAHWIAPPGTPRRYDTRFFVAPAPSDQVVSTGCGDEGETVAHVWIAPAEALARHRAGEIQLVVPTVRNLQAIARFVTSEALLEAAAAASRAVPVVAPRVVGEGNGVRIVLPGDSGFESAPCSGAEIPPTVEEFNEAMRVAALRVNIAGADKVFPAGS